ncbi:MAG: site-specific integrase, partial [Acidimicrobiales bacterium]
MAMRTTAKASTVRGFGTTLSIMAPADAVRFLSHSTLRKLHGQASSAPPSRDLSSKVTLITVTVASYACSPRPDSGRLRLGVVVRVQRVVMPDGEESWTVFDDTGQVVAPVEAFLAHLQALDRSPTTVRAYAFSLRLWSEFLALVAVGWDQARAEHVSRFVAWLRSPAPNVVVLETGSARRSPATVNRHLAGLFSFYDYHARNGVPLAQMLVAWRRSNRGGYRAFLHHVGGGRRVATRPLRVRQGRHLPRTLSSEQVLALVEACEHFRDRFLLVLLAETGMFSRGPACNGRSVAGVGAARRPRSAEPASATAVVHVPRV